MNEKLIREQLIELVRKIMSAEGTEEEVHERIRLFQRSVPHPAASDLIFWDERDLTPEEIVDEALSYKLPKQSEGEKEE